MSQGGQGGSKRKSSEGATADLAVQDTWDEDDVMLFFWVTQRRLGRGMLRRSRSAQHTWRIGGLRLREPQTLYKGSYSTLAVHITAGFKVS
jgi:hypothetical protein